MSAIVFTKGSIEIFRCVEQAIAAQYGPVGKVLAMSIRKKVWPQHQNSRTKIVDFYVDGTCLTKADTEEKFSFKLTMECPKEVEGPLEVILHLKHTMIVGKHPTLGIGCNTYHVVWQSNTLCHVIM